jgi:hypothetical protein
MDGGRRNKGAILQGTGELGNKMAGNQGMRDKGTKEHKRGCSVPPEVAEMGLRLAAENSGMACISSERDMDCPAHGLHG